MRSSKRLDCFVVPPGRTPRNDILKIFPAATARTTSIVW